MSSPITTRGPFHANGWSVKWMLQSGTDNAWDPAIRLVVPDGAGHALNVPLDLHEAGDLYAALEAHMENVAEAAPITPEERDRLLRKGRQDRILKGNLKAVQEEIDNPIPTKSGVAVPASFMPRMTPTRAREMMGDHALVSDLDPEFLEAMEEVLAQWADLDTDDREIIRNEYGSRLAAALDRLAALNA